MSQYFPKPYELFRGEFNVKVDLSSDCNGNQTHNHLVNKRTLNHLATLAK